MLLSIPPSPPPGLFTPGPFADNTDVVAAATGEGDSAGLSFSSFSLRAALASFELTSTSFVTSTASPAKSYTLVTFTFPDGLAGAETAVADCGDGEVQGFVRLPRAPRPADGAGLGLGRPPTSDRKLAHKLSDRFFSCSSFFSDFSFSICCFSSLL